MNEAHQKSHELINDSNLSLEHSFNQALLLNPLAFNINHKGASLFQATITVPACLIDQLFDAAAQTQINHVHAIGFQKKEIPLAYIKQHYRLNLIEHVKEFLFKLVIINFLYEQIHIQKIPIVGDPRLSEIKIEPGADGFFVFDINLISSINLHDWKYFPFKAPRRKNYKDLDKQVEYFIEEEIELKKKKTINKVELYDWINISIAPISDDCRQILNIPRQNFWFRMGDDEVDSLLKALFIEREVGDSFNTDNQGLQEYFSDLLNTNYLFNVKIDHIIPYSYFCFDQFKNYFRIKTNKDMHKKLIEVFSYRNDISQRRAMVEESLALLLSKHKFDVPKHLVLRQQKNILASIRTNPDYNVYRKQNDFQNSIEQLACRQIREMVLVDHVSYHDNVQVSIEDIKGYLNLTKRNRMKEFLYFDIPETKKDGQEMPIANEQLKKTCLREKTVNHIIYHLTKK